jgi:hypothetical protein
LLYLKPKLSFSWDKTSERFCTICQQISRVKGIPRKDWTSFQDILTLRYFYLSP